MNTHPRNPPATDQAQQLINAVEDALQPATLYRDDSPVPVVGSAPPVPQPGRPPMSQRATDASALMLAGGASSLLIGGSASLVMLASGYADPVVCAILLGSPAVLVLAISRLLSRAKNVIPGDTHNHYTGAVYQQNQTINSSSQWFGKATNNQ